MPESFLTGLLALVGGVGGTVLLLLPGLVLSRILVGDERGPDTTALEQTSTAASGGILVHLICLFWTLPLADRLIDEWEKNQGLPPVRYFETGAWALSVLVLGPALLAVGLKAAASRKRKYPRAAWVRFFVGLLRPPSPQDARWSVFRTLLLDDQGRWVRVILKDGRMVIGPWDKLCVASSDFEQYDMYLARTVPVEADGSPQAGAEPGEPAIWIPGPEISLVQFFSGETNAQSQAN